jgi:hypothetical protein
MFLRIKLQRGRPIQRKQGKNRHVALAFGALLKPVALMAYVLGFWRLASDMGFAGAFGITGLFSHWQIWIVTAAALHIAAVSLNRYGTGGTLEGPRILMFPLFPSKMFPRKHSPVRKLSSR